MTYISSDQTTPACVILIRRNKDRVYEKYKYKCPSQLKSYLRGGNKNKLKKLKFLGGNIYQQVLSMYIHIFT